MSPIFGYPVDVRWRDVDALGHVNHAVFLTYLEEGRDAFYTRALGSDPLYVVARIEVDLRAEVRYPDRRVTARIAVERLGKTSLTTRETVLAPARGGGGRGPGGHGPLGRRSAWAGAVQPGRARATGGGHGLSTRTRPLRVRCACRGGLLPGYSGAGSGRACKELKLSTAGTRVPCGSSARSSGSMPGSPLRRPGLRRAKWPARRPIDERLVQGQRWCQRRPAPAGQETMSDGYELGGMRELPAAAWPRSAGVAAGGRSSPPCRWRWWLAAARPRVPARPGAHRVIRQPGRGRRPAARRPAAGRRPRRFHRQRHCPGASRPEPGHPRAGSRRGLPGTGSSAATRRSGRPPPWALPSPGHRSRRRCWAISWPARERRSISAQDRGSHERQGPAAPSGTSAGTSGRPC